MHSQSVRVGGSWIGYFIVDDGGGQKYGCAKTRKGKRRVYVNDGGGSGVYVLCEYSLQ